MPYSFVLGMITYDDEWRAYWMCSPILLSGLHWKVYNKASACFLMDPFHNLTIWSECYAAEIGRCPWSDWNNDTNDVTGSSFSSKMARSFENVREIISDWARLADAVYKHEKGDIQTKSVLERLLHTQIYKTVFYRCHKIITRSFWFEQGNAFEKVQEKQRGKEKLRRQTGTFKQSSAARQVCSFSFFVYCIHLAVCLLSNRTQKMSTSRRSFCRPQACIIFLHTVENHFHLLFTTRK